MGIYSKKDLANYNKLISAYDNHKKSFKSGGVCDMTFFKFFREDTQSKIGDSTGIIDNSTYDCGILMSNNGKNLFKTRFYLKKLIWQNDLPYGELISGQKILLNTLHFQGRTKKYMKRILSHKNVFPFATIFAKSFYEFVKFFHLSAFIIKIKNSLKKF